MAFVYKTLILATLFGVFISSANAQDAGSLQRELQLQIERSAPSPEIKRIKPSEPKKLNPAESKISVKGFQFTGNTLISTPQLQTVVNPWVNTDITFADLKDVTIAIQNLYANQKRIAIANIPPQEIKDGVILIEIREGKLGSVIVEPTSPDSTSRMPTEIAKLYFSKDANGSQFIDSSSLERSVILLNELPGVMALGSFEPGSKPEETNFRVKLNGRPFFAGQAVLSNYGSPNTGAGQALANLSFNNFSGSGDQGTIDAIQSLGSTYAQLGYSLPVGYDGLRLGIQGSYLSYQTLASWSAIQTQGTANTIGANASYALIREFGNTMNLRASIDDRKYSNNQLGFNISEYQVTAFNLGVNGNFYDTSRSVINYSLISTTGNLSIKNASQSEQDSLGPGTAGTYQKYSFSVSRNNELSFLPNTNWLLSAYGQFANKNLNSSEQIYLGGPYAVRAYPVAQGGSSQGTILSTELQYRLNQHWQIGGFVDAGWVQQFVTTYSGWQGLTNANNTYQLFASGLTAKYALDSLAINAALAMRVGQNPLYNSSGQQLNVDNAYRTMQGWIRASYAF
jgi:hemolysin activation/secretion protein